MKLFDLSHSIKDNMPVFPGDENISLTQNKFFIQDKYNNFILQAGMHIGTHIDTPMHMTDSQMTIDEYPLENFCGNGVLIDINKPFDYLDHIQKNDIIFIHTGHSKKYGTKAYYHEYPTISEALIQKLINKQVKMIGIDSPSPDYYPFPIHKSLFQNKILLIENLCALDKLKPYQSFHVYAFPLKIKADASLVRVVAMVNDL